MAIMKVPTMHRDLGAERGLVKLCEATAPKPCSSVIPDIPACKCILSCSINDSGHGIAGRVKSFVRKQLKYCSI